MFCIFRLADTFGPPASRCRGHLVGRLALLFLLVFFVTPRAATLAQSGNSPRSAPPPKVEDLDPSAAAMSLEIPAEFYERAVSTPQPSDADPFKVSSSVAAAATPGWTTILFEDGEGSFPSGNGWTTFDSNSASGDDYWDDLTCRSYSGSWSMWSADIGDQTDCLRYDNDMTSWMLFGPFNLADASDARAEFRVWSQTERPDIPYDYFFWGASSDGTNFHGYRLTADTNWALRELDLTNVPTLGDLTGDSSVWFGFAFVSDSSVNSYEGSYVDDILIEKLVADQADLVATDVYFRDQPNGGNLVTDPTPDDVLYPHFNYTVSSPSGLSGKIWSIEINNSALCSFTGTVSSGSWVGWCTSPISLLPGIHSLHGEVDPDGTIPETNEGNNDAFRNYSVDGAPGSFTLSNEAPVCDTEPPGPSPAVRLNWTTSSSADSYDVYRNGSFYSGGHTGNTFYNSANVSAGQTYSYFIRARNSAGATDSNTISVFVPSGICDADIRIQPLTINFDSAAAGSFQGDQDQYLLLLKRGPYTPEPGSAGALEDAEETRHLLIQFEEEPDDDLVRELAALEVKILQKVPRRAVVATVPPGVDPSAVPGVRWVGVLRSEQKISRRVEDAGFAGFTVVDFFPDVGKARISEILAAAGASPLPNPYLRPGSRLLATDGEVVSALAGFDEVSWIRVASQAEVSGDEIFHCPGALTELGPVASFVAHDDGWDGPGQGAAHDLRYHFDNGTGDISGSLEEAEVERAFAEWEKHAALTYTETTTSGLNRSMDVLWATGSHGDGSPFDGPGGVLAHNFYPAPPNPEPIGGDMHLDDAETWRIGAGSSGFDLFSVALHEAGHGLGLAHSSDPGAVMFPSISPSTVFPQLAADDIAGIQSIYAPASTGGAGSFTIFNDGVETLDVSSISLNSSAPWISWTPAAPFSVAPGGSVGVDVTVNFASAPNGQSTRRLLVASNDPDESPYPGGVYVVVDNSQTCGVSIQDLVLQDDSVTSTEVHEACSSITAGPSYVVHGPNGNAILRAPTVIFRSGFSVGSGGALTVDTVVP